VCRWQHRKSRQAEAFSPTVLQVEDSSLDLKGRWRALSLSSVHWSLAAHTLGFRDYHVMQLYLNEQTQEQVLKLFDHSTN